MTTHDGTSIDTSLLRAQADDAKKMLRKWINVETDTVLALLDEIERMQAGLHEISTHIDEADYPEDISKTEIYRIIRAALGDETKEGE